MSSLPLTVADAACAPAESHAIGVDVAADVAAALKALADPLRLRMLSLLATTVDGEACVCDLAALADVSQPTVSHHLKVLRDVGILGSERRGTWVWYRITPAYRAAVTTLLDSFAPATVAGARRVGLAGLDDVDEALDRMSRTLDLAFPEIGRPFVQHVVRESYTDLARSATISAHLVPLTERFARQRLADLGRGPGARPQVLFVCVANAGRSQLAAALLEHHGSGRVVVRSAGSTPAADVHEGVREALAELGITAVDAFPKPLTDDAVRAADVVVTLGCGDVCPVIPGVRYEDWAVGDPALASPAGVAAIRDELDARVRTLMAELLSDDTTKETP